MAQGQRTLDVGFDAPFDLSFTRFITIGIIKFIYLLAIFGLAVGWLVLVVAKFKAGEFVGGLAAISVVAAAFVVYSLFVQKSLELLVVIFRTGRTPTC